MAFRQTYFSSDWIAEEPFKGVIKADEKTNTVAICTLCPGKSGIIALSNMGKRALTSHCSGQRHLARLNARNTTVGIGAFTTRPPSSSATPRPRVVSEDQSDDANPDDPPPASVARADLAAAGASTSTTASALPPPAADSAPRGLHSFLLRDDVTKAEIWWDLYTVECHLSLRAAGRATKLFAKMFPDSAIASKVELGRTKIGYSLTHGLAPYFYDDLVDDINNCDSFVAYFDESLNKFAQQQQMDLAVRFWSNSDDMVSTRYLNSSFLGHTTSKDLLNAFLGGFKRLDIENKLLMVSMDGPNVNLKFIKDLETYLKNIKDPNGTKFLYMGSCGLHVVNNSFKTAFNEVHNWKIIIFLRSLYNLFKDNPSRRSDLITLSKSNLLPRKFCSVRWLENKDTAIRAKDLIPNLVPFIHYIESEPKRKIKSFSYSVVKQGVEDKLMPAKLAFFCALADEVEPFMRRFQSKEPMAPFLHTDLTAILVNLLSMIVPKAIMDKETSVHSINLDDSKNLISAKDFRFQFSVKAELRKVKLTDKQMLEFKVDCLDIVKMMLKKLLLKSPLKYNLCKAISFCDPALLADKTSACCVRLGRALTIFQENNWLSGSDCDSILREFKLLCAKPNVKEAFKSYDRSKVRLDHFWRGIAASCKVSDLLWKFIKKVLILSQGNADVERGFSINKEIIVENLLNESLVAQRQVYDGLQNLGGVDKMTDIPKKMILKVRNAHSLYKEDMGKKKKEKESRGHEEVNKRRLIEQVEELKKKKLKVIADKQKELEAIQEELDSIAPGCH